MYRIIKCPQCDKVIGIIYFQKLIEHLKENNIDQPVYCVECALVTLNNQCDILEEQIDADEAQDNEWHDEGCPNDHKPFFCDYCGRQVCNNCEQLGYCGC